MNVDITTTNEEKDNKIYITETILRDAQQSKAATRMRMEDMLPALELMDDIGYWSVECWGGATFDSCMRFLDEDPWDRLRTIKKHMPKTRLQMLLRGQNLLGYRHYSDDVVEAFVKKSIENGIDVVRMFDALNDLKNLETSARACKEYGGWCEMGISYTTSPIHNEKYFVDLAKSMEDMGADSICIKDMSNLLLPQATYTLVKGIKEKVSIPIHVHTHNTCGTGEMDYMLAAQAGASIIDTAISPMSNGTSQPATETMVAGFQGTSWDTGLDLQALSRIADHFRQLSERYIDEGLMNAKVLSVNTDALRYQVPGGMLSNLVSQLQQANKLDRFYDVLDEVPRVRRDFGYPPLVTPSSQIVGTQAVMNILTGERYKMTPKESKDIVRGAYGELPGEVNEEVQKKIIGDLPIVTGRPADLLEPELPAKKAEMEAKGIGNGSEEDLLSYTLFPQVAVKFLQQRDETHKSDQNIGEEADSGDGSVRVLYVQDMTI